MDNFIVAEQFLNQSVKVRSELIKWWKLQIGDLSTGRHDAIVCVQSERDIEALEIYKGKPYATPLLQMHQFIQFIEDKKRNESQYYKL